MRGPGRHTKEFKIEAIRLLESGDKPVSEIGNKGTHNLIHLFGAECGDLIIE